MGSYDILITNYGDGTIDYAILDNRIIVSGWNNIRRANVELSEWFDYIYDDNVSYPILTVFQNEVYVNNKYWDTRLWKINESFTGLSLVCNAYTYDSQLLDVKATDNKLYAIIPEGIIIKLNETKDGWEEVYTFASGNTLKCLTVLNNRLYIGTEEGNLYRLTEDESDIELICSMSNSIDLLSVCNNNIYCASYNYLFRVDLDSNSFIFINYAPSGIYTIVECYGDIFLGCDSGYLCKVVDSDIIVVLTLENSIWSMVNFNNKLYLSVYYYGHLGRYNSIGELSFYADTTSGYVPLEVNFYHNAITSDFPIIGYHWDFGDSESSTEENPTHIYNSGMWADVTFTVYNEYDSKSITYYYYIEVLEYLRIYYNGNGHTSGTVPEDPNLYEIGQNAIILEPGDLQKEGAVFVYWNTQPDGYGTVYNPDDSVIMSDTIILYAIWRENKIGGLIGSSYDTTKIESSYWDIDTSGINYSSGGEGKSTSELKNQSTFEGWDFDNVWRMIENLTYPQFLVADFEADVTSGNTPLTVQFTNLTSIWPEDDALFVEREWDFGDGHTSSDLHPVHIYNTGGIYTVSLVERRNYIEVSRTRTNYITVGSKVIDFMGTPRIGNIFLVVKFKDLSTGVWTSWLWDFGDGRISVQQNPIHYYKHPGVYTVKLTISGPEGTFTITKEKYIFVNSLSTPDIAPEPDINAYLWGTGVVNKNEHGIKLKGFFR